MWSPLHLVLLGLRQRAVLKKTPEQIRAIQQARLRQLVACAKANSPFHAARLQHIDPERCGLAELPTFNKTQMMTNFDRFLTVRDVRQAEVEKFMSEPARLGEWYLGKYAVSHTSGTSGVQAVIVQDRRMMELLFALQMLRGSALTQTRASIFKRLFQRTRFAVVTIGRGFYPSAAALAYQPAAAHFFMRQLWLSQIEPLHQVVAKLNEFQPEVLLAYANVLEILAREVHSGRLKIGAAGSLRQLMNMSEPLSAGARKFTEESFGLPVTDNYAMGECMALTTGCARGQGMHLQADWAILEVVDRLNRPVPDGQHGEKVLITNLYNTIQPFIRYEVNDVVTLSAKPCICGSPFPLIEKVEGRTDEVVWIKDGDGFRQVHPYVFVDVLDEFPAVGWYQIVQTERNRFVLRAAPAPGRTVTLDELREVMRKGLQRFHLADLIQLEIEIHDQVAPDPKTGKLKRITSLIGKPEQVG